MHLETKEGGKQTKSCREGEVAEAGGSHGGTPRGGHEVETRGLLLMLTEVMMIGGGACGLRPLAQRAMGDVGRSGRWGFPAGIRGARVASAVKGDHFVFLDESLTDGAFVAGGMATQPAEEARPAEEVPAEGHNGVLRELEADVAIKAAGRRWLRPAAAAVVLVAEACPIGLSRCLACLRHSRPGRTEKEKGKDGGDSGEE